MVVMWCRAQTVDAASTILKHQNATDPRLVIMQPFTSSSRGIEASMRDLAAPSARFASATPLLVAAAASPILRNSTMRKLVF
eukprot:6178262-Pleurochrysis_carterae.AAC.3